MDILNEGVARLKKLGLDPTAKLVLKASPLKKMGNLGEADWGGSYCGGPSPTERI